MTKPERLRFLANELCPEAQEIIDALCEYADALEKCEPVAEIMEAPQWERYEGEHIVAYSCPVIDALPVGTKLYTALQTVKAEAVKVPDEKTCEIKFSCTHHFGNPVSTECGHHWKLSNDNNPKTNNFEFCPYCGGKINEVK